MRRTVFLLFLLVLTFVPFGSAQRLPDNVVPSHYELTFAPNFQNDSFSGEETIDVTLARPSKTITLNANEIDFQKTTVTAAGKTQTATTTYDAANESATLNVAKMIPAGRAQLNIRYTGVLNGSLRGLYLSKTSGRKYAVTQFEPTDARRAFPSFDEPAYKATFDIHVIAQQGDNAISNGKLISDTPGPGSDKHTLSFATTPKMSTYLVALAVGDWKCSSGEQDGIPLRVCSVPGKEQYTRFALEATKNILKFYDQYYGVKYPFGKLDQLAVPDFEAGAMENTGAIIYRETDLLLDEKTASVNAKKKVAEVVAHEMAHQWFGDLVTMKWWNDIWLNEGFATWMEMKPVGAWHPEWNIGTDEAQETQTSLGVDSMVHTRPIRQSAETPAEINALFDGIAYGKTAAVLRMLESYVGSDVFRDGVNAYLKAHSYGNATAEDFWSAMAAASNKPIDQIMPTFVNQPGVPFVELSLARDGNALAFKLQQRRFYLDPALLAKGTNELWQIPVCLKVTGPDPTTSTRCEMLTQKEQTFRIDGATAVSFADAGAYGYYRFATTTPEAFSASMLEKQFTPAERVALVGNEWALVRTGVRKIDDYMHLAEALKSDRTRAVVTELASRYETIGRYLVSAQDRAEFDKWVRTTLGPVLQDVGYTGNADDNPDRRLIRAAVFETLGNTGEDATVIAKARQLTADYMRDANSVEPSLAHAAVDVAAAHGDATLYQALRQQLSKAQSPQEYYLFFYSLAEFRDPALVTKTLDWALTPEVRNQDMGIISSAIANPYVGQQAWNWLKEHYAQVTQKSTIMSGSRLARATANFCDAGLRDDVLAFFASHRVPAGGRAVGQVKESVDYCIDLKQSQAPLLSDWLGKQRMGQQAGAAQ